MFRLLFDNLTILVLNDLSFSNIFTRTNETTDEI